MSDAELAELERADARLRTASGELLSLCPGRGAATPLATHLRRAMRLGAPESVVTAYARGLRRIGEAQLDNFPGNLFWDLDYPAACLLAEGMQSGLSPDDAANRVDESVQLVESVERAFGRHTPIHFRYVHDFVYGFDWARWVAADPDGRKDVGPFARPFLEYLLRRAREIETLIAEGDDEYGPLPEGEHRNPFGFARDPRDEEILHRDLAARGLIPVEAWRYDAEPAWERPFSALREQRAAELGLMKKP